MRNPGNNESGFHSGWESSSLAWPVQTHIHILPWMGFNRELGVTKRLEETQTGTGRTCKSLDTSNNKFRVKPVILDLLGNNTTCWASIVPRPQHSPKHRHAVLSFALEMPIKLSNLYHFQDSGRTSGVLGSLEVVRWRINLQVNLFIIITN